MKKFTSFLTVAFLTLFTPLWVFAAANVSTIKIADVQGDTEPSVVALRDVFAKYVADKSDGLMKDEVYTNSSLGNTNTVFQGLQFGTI